MNIYAKLITFISIFTFFTNNIYAQFEDGTVVTPALLKEAGLVKKELDGIKVLGEGKLEKKLTVQANKFSKSAIEKINESGSKIEVI